MGRERKAPERAIVRSLVEIPEFASEDEERAWWATHDLAEELGIDVTAEHHALIQRLKVKYRYMPRPVLEPKAAQPTTS
jgi:hypothetical protein